MLCLSVYISNLICAAFGLICHYPRPFMVNKRIIPYIKRFDWVIGHQVHFNENHVITEQTYKLYAKPHVSDTIIYPTRNYALTTSDGTLKIITRLIDGNERFEVGDQIISVDGENITEENICYYYELLTETKDWSGFDIKVK